ncbi:MAG: hypothetical protein KKC76_05000 [Proteobacteria bacterium]|nr:hypothetical protein [Pseudomonadota bacterium]MBU4297550.1 hypothetical protein [Pseudomonadota bacterium]MCG2746952.1 hypothetical protein [Desulfobulbaceae bacterium]
MLLARFLKPLGGESFQEGHDADLAEEVEELIEESCLARAVDFLEVLATGEIRGDTGLTFNPVLPAEALGNIV